MRRDEGPQKDPGAAEAEVAEVADAFVEHFEQAVDKALPPHLRARAWARRRKSTHFVWRAGVLLVGLGLVGAGLVMLVLPGPGWAAIIVGLIILASEYAWARNLLDPIKRWAGRAADLARDPRHRRRNVVIGALVVALIAAALLGWLVVFRR